MENGFVKAIDTKGMLMGAAALAGAIALLLMGVLNVMTFKIGSLVLPSWTMYIAGGIVGVIGIFLLVGSADARKCPKCGKLAESDEAWFPLEQLDAVMDAVKKDQPEVFSDMQKEQQKQTKTVVRASYCTGCREVAEITVDKWEDYRFHPDLIPTKLVTGRSAKAYADLIEAHVEWRGEDE